jgi:drug/metabolite transporter (DMT)-like permease
MRNWILFSVLAMLANVAKVLMVKYRCEGIDSRVVVFCGRVVSAAVLIPFLWTSGIGFPTDGIFWLVIVVTSLMTAFASVLFTDAVKFGKLTVVMPMQAAVPVFSLLTLWAFWKELPKSASIVLMLLSMAAVAWTLYADSRDKTANGKMVFVWLSLVSAVLFGVCTILDRVAIGRLTQGALAYSACWNLFSAMLMGTEVARAKSLRQMQWRPAIFALAVYSAAALSAFFFQQYAVQLSQAIPGAVVHVKSIGMLYLPIVVLVQSLTLAERPKPMTLAAGISAIVLSILLVRSLV